MHLSDRHIYKKEGASVPHPDSQKQIPCLSECLYHFLRFQQPFSLGEFLSLRAIWPHHGRPQILDTTVKLLHLSLFLILELA